MKRIKGNDYKVPRIKKSMLKCKDTNILGSMINSNCTRLRLFRCTHLCSQPHAIRHQETNLKRAASYIDMQEDRHERGRLGL